MEKSIMRALQKCMLYDGLSEQDIETVLSKVTYQIVKYQKKEIYSKAGQENHFVDLIVSGEIKARMETKSGRCLTIASKTIGMIITYVFIFAKDTSLPMTIETAKPTVVLRMKPETFQNIINENVVIQKNFIKLLSTTAANLARQMRQLTLFTVKEKVSLFLLEESKRRNSDNFTMNLSRQEIADTFAIQKYSLQRVLSEYDKMGAIRLKGKSITILDRQKLLSLADL